MGGCNDDSRTPAPRAPLFRAQVSPDSLKRAIADALIHARQRTLDERPDYVGAVTDILATRDDAASTRVTIRLRPSGEHQSLSHQHIRIDIREEGIAWRADRTPLPLDSLQIGDWVRLWVGGVSAILPVNPPTLPARALQQLDTLPPN